VRQELVNLGLGHTQRHGRYVPHRTTREAADAFFARRTERIKAQMWSAPRAG
jgi:hypothetical protein